jgi:hypothetical protein
VTTITAETPDLLNAAVASAMSEPKKEVKEAIPVPLPPEGAVHLPGGWFNKNGEHFQEAEVRELNGEDEEYIAKSNSNRNQGKLVAALLERAVVSIGGNRATKDMLEDLLIGDRDMLLMGIRVATYGDELEMAVMCPNCDNKIDLLYQFSVDVPVKELEDPTQREFKVQLRKNEATITLPDGRAQMAVFNSNKKTAAELNSLLLEKCLKYIDGQPPIGGVVNAVKFLNLKDRQTLIEFMIENQPGPQYGEVKQTCDQCEQEFPLVLGMSDLFPGL